MLPTILSHVDDPVLVEYRDLARVLGLAQKMGDYRASQVVVSWGG